MHHDKRRVSNASGLGLHDSGHFSNEEAFSMRDNEARGLVLKRLYEIHHQVGWAQPHHFNDLQLEPDILANILQQLAEKNLIDWKPLQSGSRIGIVTFMARIRALGVDVVEGTVPPPFAITIDSSVNVQGSQNVQIGQGHTQSISLHIRKLITAVDHSTATEAEKIAAKSLFQKIAENPLVNTILGNLIKGAGGG
jgi:hypothetical protein